MKYCRRCVQPNTRPGIYFGESNICGACLYEEEKENINWKERQNELKYIKDWAKKESEMRKSNYDCAIGVSGGKDSTFQALYARNNLNLHPLLVNSEPEGISEIGKKNIENLKQLGFDVISLRPNPKVMKKLIKKDFYEYLNPIKVTEFSLYSSVYIIANKFNIPLIIQGENPGITLGVRNTGVGINNNALNANKLDTLSSGYKRYIGNGISEKDLFMFNYDINEIIEKEIKGIWLNYYVKEWSQPHNAKFSISYGLTIRPEYFNPYDFGTYSPYYQMDSNLVQLNQMLKYYKLGFGQCTDHACYDIREKLITRDQGIELVKKYDGKVSIRYIINFCDMIDISINEFWNVVDKFVNRNLFEKDKKGNWKPKFEVGIDFLE